MRLSISYFILATLAKCKVAEALDCSDNVVVFGDSYSDTGNLFQLSGFAPSPRAGYDSGRFTNGKVWIEYFADLMGLDQPKPHYKESVKGTNYAIGAAASGASEDTEWTPILLPGVLLGPVPAKGLILQTNDFIFNSDTSSQCASEMLFVIWTGAVDLMLLGTDVDKILKNIDDSISSLVIKGATKVVVLNLPQLADSPGYDETGNTLFLSETFPNDLRVNVTDFNTRLVPMLESIETNNNNGAIINGKCCAYPKYIGACEQGVDQEGDVCANEGQDNEAYCSNYNGDFECFTCAFSGSITHVDIASLFAEAAEDPDKFGLDANVITPTINERAFYVDQAETFVQNAQNALWYDGIHPSTTFHKAVAKEVHSVVTGTSTENSKCGKSAKTGKKSKAPKK